MCTGSVDSIQVSEDMLLDYMCRYCHKVKILEVVAKCDHKSVDIKSMIRDIRGQQVMLDYDLAYLYGVETKRLKEQVNRNIERFPDDFMFKLTREELNSLRSQICDLKLEGWHTILSQGDRVL